MSGRKNSNSKRNAPSVSQKTSKAGDNKKGTKKEVEEKEEKGIVRVNWSKDYALTDQIIQYLLPNPIARAVLKFAPGDGKPATTDGTSANHHCSKMAEIILISHDSGTWKHSDIKGLSLSVKNRIDKLQRDYKSWKNRLDSTGEGITQEEREGKYQNLREKQQKEFPWYDDLKLMLHNHPILDKANLVNSKSVISLGLLEDGPEYESSDVGDIPEDSERPDYEASDEGDADASEFEVEGDAETADKEEEDVPEVKETTRKPRKRFIDDEEGEEVALGEPATKKVKKDATKPHEKEARKGEPNLGSKTTARGKGNATGKTSGTVNNLIGALKEIAEDRSKTLKEIVEADGDTRRKEAKIAAEKEIKMLKMQLDAKERMENRKMEHELALASLRSGSQVQGGHFTPNLGINAGASGSQTPYSTQSVMGIAGRDENSVIGGIWDAYAEGSSGF